MNRAKKTIWIVDDDEDERLLIQDAFLQIQANIELVFLGDGEALLSCLRNRKPFEDKKRFPLPNLILLDLNMPALSGHEVLKMIKTDDRFKSIPVIIYTTSGDERDVRESYENGANAYIVKPVNYSRMLDVFASLERFWIGTATLPSVPSFHKPSPIHKRARQTPAPFGNVPCSLGRIGQVVSAS